MFIRIGRIVLLVVAVVGVGRGALAADPTPPRQLPKPPNVFSDDLDDPFPAHAGLYVPQDEFPLKDKTALRLVPFPKSVKLLGGFRLKEKLVLEAPAGSAKLLGGLIAAEMRRAGLPVPEIRGLESETPTLQLSISPRGRLIEYRFRRNAMPGEYGLKADHWEIVCHGRDEAGLLHAVHTLCQLIRANRHGDTIPAVTIHDWPSLRWRCFQDDLTRGPSSTLATLKQHVDLGAELKMNLFTYYMEYQYAFKKHPLIGPKNGSLTPEDLAAVVEYAKLRHVDVLGNQQSFGHFAHILKHEQYAPLRETGSLLCPVKEESYQLLDDLYSEVCPLLPFEMFNVCCDETWGLGTGPSKELAEKIGVGGVYVEHVRRVHDLLRDKYQKRMMMWGDIILQHPDKLDQIPKDTVMLTWGYGAQDSFENQIVPFAKSGYEFFVCPGINNWSRILPDFGATTTNIRNFVRDGAKHGALGMLNTAWEDDGEALQGYKWHGYAWGAECAWNASKTTPEDFNRRIGAVVFGEKGDHFGRAIELLAQTHRLPGMQGMNNRRFWQDDFRPQRGAAATRAAAERLLEIVRPAVEHLEACKQEATVNAALLDSFLHGARRMELIGTRMLDGLKVAEVYGAAYEAARHPGVQQTPTGSQAPAWEPIASKRSGGLAPAPKPELGNQIEALLAEAEKLVAANRDAHAALGKEFARIWLSESKPYALDRTMARYAAAVKRYDDLARRLADARRAAEASKPLPTPGDLGLALPESFTRRTRLNKIETGLLHADAPWAEPTAERRVGLLIGAGSVDRWDLPVELDLALPSELAAKPIRAFCLTGNAQPREIPAQLDPSGKAGQTRLSLLVPGPLAKGSKTPIHVYLGLSQAAKPLPGAVSTKHAPDGTKWIENDRVRLLLGPEGGHVYRWQIKSLGDRDLTMPGTDGWAGFSDLAQGHRSTTHKLVCTGRGPAVVRYVCTDTAGLVKTVRLFAGASWMEVVLAEPTGHYWDFDDPKNFAADGPTPGTYLFADGKTGAVGKQADGVPAQQRAGNVHWAVKFNDKKLALGLATPEVAAAYLVAPGDSAGGVGIERSAPACHFVTFAGILEKEPAETMNHLRQTLDFRNQPELVLYAMEVRK